MNNTDKGWPNSYIMLYRTLHSSITQCMIMVGRYLIAIVVYRTHSGTVHSCITQCMNNSDNGWSIAIVG